MTAHRQLEEAGNNGGLGFPDSMKIHLFKSGVKESAALENALENARIAPHIGENFEKLTNHLRESVNAKILRMEGLGRTSNRNISGTFSQGHGKGEVTLDVVEVVEQLMTV